MVYEITRCWITGQYLLLIFRRYIHENDLKKVPQFLKHQSTTSFDRNEIESWRQADRRSDAAARWQVRQVQSL
jgi:hypothetical protein